MYITIIEVDLLAKYIYIEFVYKILNRKLK